MKKKIIIAMCMMLVAVCGILGGCGSPDYSGNIHGIPHGEYHPCTKDGEILYTNVKQRFEIGWKLSKYTVSQYYGESAGPPSKDWDVISENEKIYFSKTFQSENIEDYTVVYEVEYEEESGILKTKFIDDNGEVIVSNYKKG
jgi:hypothetical protein